MRLFASMILCAALTVSCAKKDDDPPAAPRGAVFAIKGCFPYPGELHLQGLELKDAQTSSGIETYTWDYSRKQIASQSAYGVLLYFVGQNKPLLLENARYSDDKKMTHEQALKLAQEVTTLANTARRIDVTCTTSSKYSAADLVTGTYRTLNRPYPAPAEGAESDVVGTGNLSKIEY